MAFEVSSMRAACFGICLGILGLSCAANAAPSVAPAELAAARRGGEQCDDSCIDAIMAAARQGRAIDQPLLVARIKGTNGYNPARSNKAMARPNRGSDALAVGNVDVILTTILREAAKDYAVIPEYRRALALAYLKTNEVQQAERELRNSIAAFPTHAPFWVDLAMALALQGKTDDAISALVIAEAWSEDPKRLREAYGQAAQSAPIKGMAGVYKDALGVLAANDSALERIDAGLPPMSGSGALVDSDGKPVSASVTFDRCGKPEWPRSSLRYEETGKVTLAFFVDADGKLLRAKKQISSGYVELDNAALVSIAGCRFIPAVIDGKPAAAWMQLQYIWDLEES